MGRRVRVKDHTVGLESPGKDYIVVMTPVEHAPARVLSVVIDAGQEDFRVILKGQQNRAPAAGRLRIAAGGGPGHGSILYGAA